MKLKATILESVHELVGWLLAQRVDIDGDDHDDDNIKAPVYRRCLCLRPSVSLQLTCNLIDPLAHLANPKDNTFC